MDTTEVLAEVLAQGLEDVAFFGTLTQVFGAIDGKATWPMMPGVKDAVGADDGIQHVFIQLKFLQQFFRFQSVHPGRCMGHFHVNIM